MYHLRPVDGNNVSANCWCFWLNVFRGSVEWRQPVHGSSALNSITQGCLWVESLRTAILGRLRLVLFISTVTTTNRPRPTLQKSKSWLIGMDMIPVLSPNFLIFSREIPLSECVVILLFLKSRQQKKLLRMFSFHTEVAYVQHAITVN